MESEITKPQTLVTTTAEIDPYERFALQYDDGRLLKFDHGKWLVGAEEVNGKIYKARLDLLAHGWVKFVDNKPVAKELVFFHHKPKDRSELDDPNEASWPIVDGVRRDPWSFEHYLPFEDDEEDRFVWPTHSDGGLKALGRLVGKYTRKGKRFLPRVKLDREGYDHPTRRTWIEKPKFSNVQWVAVDNDDLAVISAEPSNPAIQDPRLRDGMTVAFSPQSFAPADEYSADDMGPDPLERLLGE